MAENQGDWRSEAFRRKVIQQIDEAVRSSNTPMPKPSVEMETHVYQRAKTREEYLALVARLILHVKDFNNQRRENKMMPKMPNQQMPGASGMPTGPGIQDPINALQNMAMSGGSMGPNQPDADMESDATVTVEVHDSKAGMMGPGGQPMPPMGPGPQMRHPVPGQLQQPPQQPPRMPGQPQPRPQLQRQDAFIVTSAQAIQQPPMGQQAIPGPQSSPLSYGSVSSSGAGGGGGMMRHSPYSSLNNPMNQASPLVSSNPPSQQGASPAQPNSQMVGSPIHMMTSPSPQIVPSPASRPMTGAPSPSAAALNTPGNPNSQGAAPSPANPADEHAYLEKLKQLSKYIEPLRRMIKKTEDGKESDHRQNDISKLRNLHDILTNPSKRVPMTTLMKCEQVLEKIQFSSKTSHHTPQVHMCQPLLDSVAAHITSPTINHTLYNTFGPAMSAMFGNPIKAPSPPRKRRKVEEKSRIPDILQGEIARLDRRFKVKMDPLQHPGSKDVHLICKLDDQYLPCVPPILVLIPHDYPYNSPECSTIRRDYESTPFLRSIQRALVTHLLDLPSTFSFTSLLDMWEMSVRKACCPNS